MARRCLVLGAGARFAVAISGGRDSMALACLSAEYARNNDAHVLALIVDHGLRENSKEEAAQTVKWCEALGLEAKLLRWEGEKPTSQIQEQARAARYRLLASACNEAGVDTLMTAHSADDQAETVFMRLARGASA